ncbi:2'-5' RNA ligase family protein [Candidatus Gracilibacteria bacterium]|nr:2'-5' RNA ligase family protein [Candidatus Gracilibacteria bacterium]
MAEEPLILTVLLDEDTFRRFDGLRRTHFPPQRNLIPAHITLFHALPAIEEQAAACLRLRHKRRARSVAGLDKHGPTNSY